MTASVVSQPSAISLPAPRVRLVKEPVPTIVQVPSVSASGPLMDIELRNRAQVTVHGVSVEVLENLADNRLQLELMRYTRRHSRTTASAGSGTKLAGYAHPSNGPAPSGTGSHTHGGSHGGVPIEPLRVTEWSVTNHGQVIDVTQGAAAFMVHMDVLYRDNTGNTPTVNVLTSATASNGSSTGMGKRYPYAGTYSPGYFKARWSVVDASDPRGQRVHGPLSETFTLTNDVFPFIPDMAFDNGGILLAAAKLDPRFQSRVGRFWIGSTSRLPR